MPTAPDLTRIRSAAGAPARRRLAETLALAPGGPPSRAARLTGRAMRLFLRTVWARAPKSERGMRLLRRYVAGTPALPPPRGVRLAPVAEDGFHGEWVRAGQPDERRVLLYLHGGGYVFGSPATYRPLTWRLSAATGRPVLALDYPLAPDHGVADALGAARAAYAWLLAQGYAGSDIVVAGDSAGGHLALALMQALPAPPSHGVLLAPWADLACTGASHADNAGTEDVIPPDWLAWAGARLLDGLPVEDPAYSPVAGDYAGLPPLMIISSDSEILRDDARLVASRARGAGVPVLHHEWHGQMHVFPRFADFVPEGRAAVRHIADFLAAPAGGPAATP